MYRREIIEETLMKRKPRATWSFFFSKLLIKRMHTKDCVSHTIYTLKMI